MSEFTKDMKNTERVWKQLFLRLTLYDMHAFEGVCLSDAKVIGGEYIN